MKLFIWEGNGISSAWDDNGTLVVLAESPEQARELVRQQKAEDQAADKAWMDERDALARSHGWNGDYNTRFPVEYWADERAREHNRRMPHFEGHWDGTDEALDREPDRVVELDTPTIVAFNGGGYD